MTNTSNSGAGSLRQAIIDTNAAAGLDTIDFAISGSGVRTIQPTSALPNITGPVIIDGYTQPGATANTQSVGSDATLLIVIDGINAGGASHGLRLGAGGSTVRGVVINNFSLAGISINSGDGNSITGCRIGTDVTGTIAVPNGRGTQWDGIVVGDSAASSNNTIGGADPADRNVLSGNNGGGVWMVSSGGGNVIRNNYIGTNAAGTAAIGNSQHGVVLAGTGNSILDNVISGNGGGSYHGVYLPPGADTTIIRRNWIGLNALGNASIPNLANGLMVESPDNVIGGMTTPDRNVISGNGAYGVVISGAAADGNLIQGNFIGIDAAGTSGVANLNDGIWLADATNTTIGGASPAARNVISGNDNPATFADGIWITDGSNNTVQGNFIGTDANGSVAIGNYHSGVTLKNTSGNVIGGAADDAGNLIALNLGQGVIVETGSTDNAILGNSIHGNDGLGIDLDEDGVSANDGLLNGAEANDGMDFPVFTAASISGATLTVAGYVGSAPGQAAFAGARVEIFKSDVDVSGFGEGLAYLGFLTADGSGNFSGSLTASGLAFGDRITGTATNATNNTSEFSANVVVAAGGPPGITVVPISGLLTSEGGGTATFSIVLDSPPTNDVSVGLSSSDATEGIVALQWFGPQWTYRKQIVIEPAQVVGTASLTDFPVLVRLSTDGDLAAGAQADADDILFTSSDGVTQLAHEVERFVAASGQLVAWVKVPVVSATSGTVLYMYYGNPTTPSSQNIAGTWSSGFAMVHHLEETSGTLLDSTTNANNGVNNGATLGVAGRIGLGASFNGSTSYISVADHASLDITNSLTVSGWVNASSLTGYRTLCVKGTSTTEYNYFLGTNTTEINFEYYSGGYEPTQTSGLGLTTGAWHHLAVTYDDAGDIARLYHNGALVETDSSATVAMLANNLALTIGRSSFGEYWSGTHDEVRVENVVRSAGWLGTTYNNQNAPGSFVSVGAQQTSASPATFLASAWNTPVAVVVTGVDDALDDGDIAYSVVTDEAASADPAYDVLNPANVGVVNSDDDAAPAGITVNPTSGLLTTEAGGMDTFTIVLNTQPTANVTLGLSSSDTGEGSVAPASLTFTSANWSTPQTVTITGVDDALADGDAAYSIVTAAALSADADYSGLDPADVSVSNADNDMAGITVTLEGQPDGTAHERRDDSANAGEFGGLVPCGAFPFFAVFALGLVCRASVGRHKRSLSARY